MEALRRHANEHDYLPAEALLLLSGELAARCSFVDYDGAAALDRWREAPMLASPAEEAAFVGETF